MPAGNEPPDFGTELWLAGFLNGLLMHTSECLNSVHSVYIFVVQATGVVLHQLSVYQSFVHNGK